MRTVAICCLLLLLIGCDTLGGRTVTLKSSAPPVGVLSSPSQAQVQQVLQILDDVLAPEGARRVAADPNDQHRIAHYVGGPFMCTVSLGEDGAVVIDFRNPGFGAGRHPTPTVKKVSDTLVQKLKTEYGNKRVRIN